MSDPDHPSVDAPPSGQSPAAAPAAANEPVVWTPPHAAQPPRSFDPRRAIGLAPPMPTPPGHRAPAQPAPAAPQAMLAPMPLQAHPQPRPQPPQLQPPQQPAPSALERFKAETSDGPPGTARKPFLIGLLSGIVLMLILGQVFRAVGPDPDYRVMPAQPQPDIIIPALTPEASSEPMQSPAPQ